MKLGKRSTPQKSIEFFDFVIPHFKKEEYATCIEILKKFSKRKRRDFRKDHETVGLQVYIAYYSGIEIDFLSLCSKFGVYIETPEDLFEQTISRANNLFKFKFQTVQNFLSRYLTKMTLNSTTCDSILKYKSMDELSLIAGDYEKFQRGWQYGLNHNRSDIGGSTLVNYELLNILHQAYSEVRIENGLTPLVSKWKEEQKLFDSLKLKFPNLIVIGQGSPLWLEGQRFDIWLPQIHMAIEYNGIQHYNAIDFFGGELGLQRSKERDKRKKKKCIENNVLLLEVQENYKLQDIVNAIYERSQACIKNN